MRKIKKKFTIDGFEWLVLLDTDHSLSFYIKEKDKEMVKSGLWQDWGDKRDLGIENGYWTTDPKLIKGKIPSVKFFKKLIKELPGIIKSSGVNYFHFAPNSLKKKRLYKTISDAIINKLPGGDWTYQIAANTFYFSRY